MRTTLQRQWHPWCCTYRVHGNVNPWHDFQPLILETHRPPKLPPFQFPARQRKDQGHWNSPPTLPYRTEIGGVTALIFVELLETISVSTGFSISAISQSSSNSYGTFKNSPALLVTDNGSSLRSLTGGLVSGVFKDYSTSH